MPRMQLQLVALPIWRVTGHNGAGAILSNRIMMKSDQGEGDTTVPTSSTLARYVEGKGWKTSGWDHPTE